MLPAHSVSTVIIEGVIDPTLGVNHPCGKENRPPSPYLSRLVNEETLENLELVRDNFESLKMEDELFWKERMIIHVSTCRVLVSATFCPIEKFKKRVLFVQNREGDPIGFVAPFLSSEQKKKYHAHEHFDQCAIISKEMDLAELVNGLDPLLQQELLTCLEYFLEDETSSALGLTYQDSRGHYITQGWVKASSC